MRAGLFEADPLVAALLIAAVAAGAVAFLVRRYRSRSRDAGPRPGGRA